MPLCSPASTLTHTCPPPLPSHVHVQGYSDPRLERLRQGIGPEDRDDVLLPLGPPPGFSDTKKNTLTELQRWARGQGCCVRAPRALGHRSCYCFVYILLLGSGGGGD